MALLLRRSHFTAPSNPNNLSICHFPPHLNSKLPPTLPPHAKTLMMSPQPGYSGVDASTQQKKKITIAGVSALLLLAVVGTVATVMTRQPSSSPSSTPAASDGGSATSVKAIQSICQPTDYKQQCEDSLSKSAGNTTDPKQLVQAAFQVTVDYIHQALNRSKVLQDAANDPRTKSALDQCGQLMDYATDELKTSIDQLGDLDITKVDVIVNDLKVWLSAVLTYQETCIDGFENTTGNAADEMKKALTASSQLTSNALAIIDNIASVLTSFDLSFLNRRLLSQEEKEVPEWIHSKRMLLDDSANVKPDLVVAQDGSGDFKTINEALGKVPMKSDKGFVMYIKAGIYKEQVIVGRAITNLMMYGDGPTKTVITGGLNFIDGTPTFKTASFGVIGDGFVAKNMGFENSAGAAKHQAVALRVQSDHSIFYNCRMDGYQDTLYAHTKRQFYRDCTVSGTIDFIFGDAAVIFQNCKFIVRKPMELQQTIITAQGRKDVRQPSGIVLHNCTLTADPAYLPVANRLKAYLGRPWKEYSRTIIMQSEIDEFISPDGWLPWMGTFGLNTLFYSEFDNRGPGAAKTDRVKWQGLKTISVDDAMKYTVEQFIEGDLWLKPTGVPYIPGLLPMSEEGRMH